MNSGYVQKNINLMAVIVVALFVTSLGLVASSHDCRAKYSMLQRLELEGWSLQEDHSRLLIEHSTWASYDRVREVATESLFMKAPELNNLVLIYE